jgi:hypothetical protein
MRRIAVIGSGQAGLLTAHGLLKAGYQVTVYSDKTPEQFLKNSRPTGTAGRFELSLQYERELGLNFWEREAPDIEGVDLVFCMQPRQPFITLRGRFEKPALAIDLRLQSVRWLEELTRRGGILSFETVDIPRLDAIAAEHDLTIIAAGRGPLADLFPRDDKRSVYDKPQRNLAMVIVKNASMNFPHLSYRPVKFNFIGTSGEAFWVPYYHKDLGHTWNLVFEAKPGGANDRFEGVKTGAEAVRVGKELIRDLFPWDWEWAKDMELADENGWLVGKITPTVRRPVGCLPSGRAVTGVGDTLMAFDPISGQGANNGNKMARNLVECITQRGDAPFDAEWMEVTFERFYNDHGVAAYTFNNLLLEPITDAGKELLIAQYGSTGQPGSRNARQAIANAFCENFVDPRSLTDAFLDMDKARRFIASQSGKSWRWSAAGGRFSVIKDQLGQKLGLTSVAN